MNHHLDTAQRETPYWDYKQKYNLQDTERNLYAQHSQLLLMLSPPVGNTLWDMWTSLRESRSRKKKWSEAEKQSWGGTKKETHKHWMEKSVCSVGCGEKGNKQKGCIATNKVLLRQQIKLTGSITVEGWNWFIWVLSHCTEQRFHIWNDVFVLDCCPSQKHNMLEITRTIKGELSFMYFKYPPVSAHWYKKVLETRYTRVLFRSLFTLSHLCELYPSSAM